MHTRHLKLLAPQLFAIMFFTLGMLCHAEAFAGDPSFLQSRASYEAAIHNASSSPSYVLISISDSETGKARPVCTTANFLLGAIHREYALDYGRSDASKAVEIALARQDHAFVFHRREALDNIPVRYSGDELAKARALLAPLSTDALKAGFASLYRDARLATDGYARDAIACALIERGLSPRMADISGQIYIAQ